MSVTVNELPNTNCPETLAYCHCIERIRHQSLHVVASLLAQNPPNAKVVLPLVAIAIAQRVDEIAASATILLLKGRERDAGVLILSAYELQLDAMYMALDPVRAQVWLDHVRENVKPWKVRDLQTALFPDLNEFEAEQEIYRKYSMIKHCNPAGGIFAFPIAVSRNQIHLDNANGPRFAFVHLYGLGIAVVRTLTAVSSVVQDHGFEIERTMRSLNLEKENLNVLNKAYLLRCVEAQQNGASK